MRLSHVDEVTQSYLQKGMTRVSSDFVYGIADSGSMRTIPITDSDITMVKWSVSGLQFQGQYDADNEGIYAVTLNDYTDMIYRDGIASLRPLIRDTDSPTDGKPYVEFIVTFNNGIQVTVYFDGIHAIGRAYLYNYAESIPALARFHADSIQI